MASRLVRSNVVTVNDVLDGHKLLEIDCADRIYLTLSAPNLVVGGQVVNFLTVHEQRPIPSPALLERRGLAFRRAVASFAEANEIPVLSFAGKRDKCPAAAPRSSPSGAPDDLPANPAALARQPCQAALGLSAPRSRATADLASRKRTDTGDGAGQPIVGVPSHPRRADRPGIQDCAVDGMADPQGRGHRSRT
jgi:hypothetical protein